MPDVFGDQLRSQCYELHGKTPEERIQQVYVEWSEDKYDNFSSEELLYVLGDLLQSIRATGVVF